MKELLKEALGYIKLTGEHAVSCNFSNRRGECDCGAYDLIDRIEAELAKPERKAMTAKQSYENQTDEHVRNESDWQIFQMGWASALKDGKRSLDAPTSRNPERMTRERVHAFRTLILRCLPEEEDCLEEAFFKEIEAIQNAPFVPDWSKMPTWSVGFRGLWSRFGEPDDLREGEFYIPAPIPTPPTDAELVAMFEALPISEKMAKLGVKA